MSRISIARIRTVAVAGLMLSVMVLTGCGSQTGPSDDKARLDLQDRVTQMFRGMATLDDFQVAERQVLSEDRVKLHVSTRFKKNEAKMRQVKQSNRVMGGWSPALDRAEKIDDSRGKATLVYKRSGDNVWQLYRVQQGYQ